MAAKETNFLVTDGINSKGYGIIPRLVMKDKRMGCYPKALYSYFCSCSNGCLPDNARIMEDLQLSEEEFNVHMKTLIDLGYVKVTYSGDLAIFKLNTFVSVSESDY